MTDDQREQYEERAAIAEHHGGLSKREAEEVARREIEKSANDKPSTKTQREKRNEAT